MVAAVVRVVAMVVQALLLLLLLWQHGRHGMPCRLHGSAGVTAACARAAVAVAIAGGACGGGRAAAVGHAAATALCSVRGLHTIACASCRGATLYRARLTLLSWPAGGRRFSRR